MECRLSLLRRNTQQRPAHHFAPFVACRKSTIAAASASLAGALQAWIILSTTPVQAALAQAGRRGSAS